MRKLKYVGSAQVSERNFSKADFTDNGIEDQGAVKFNRRNRFTEEVSDEAADLLMETGEFEEVETPKKESSTTSTTGSTTTENKGGKK